ncbi:MAG: ROK family protein [Candidatus Microsaccharimonas sossegonensis]|uniref:ROK family protein n=1 Tax=Candidatus Microsaccharimonas sossegonensis TaxID=2506948 RepID=A0A4Q0AH84_9BACT|nr:MAG: ROK family protein [Candidatus Microsaccharimonas sossegonensis]
MLVAVDTGGTKTLVASFLEDGRIGEQFQFPTPKTTLEWTATLKTELHNHFGNGTVAAVVVAMPGIVKDGIAIWCNNLKWMNFDVAQALKGILGDAPLFVENDANLAGLAETRQLKEVPPLALYVTVSTGIGSGIITEGKINPALRYSEAGRSLVEFDGVVREWESFASGKAIYQAYGKYARDITSRRVWHTIANRISRGFLAIIPVLQPDVIIIGGSIGTYFDHFGKDLTGLLNEHLPAHIPAPKVVQAKHPELAVIYGCYYYALDALAAA